LDEIIIWSGWIVAVGMGIWKIVETLRNRPAIKAFIGLSENKRLIKLTVINVGHRPVNLIRAGLQYADGYNFDFPPIVNISLGWFYNMQPRSNSLILKQIKYFLNELSEQGAPTKVKFIYFTDESGHRYRVKLPSHIRDALHS